MKLRNALLAVTLVLAGTSLRAQDFFQMTVQGQASPTVPVTITAVVNTPTGSLNPDFGPDPEVGGPPGNVTLTLAGSVPLTQYQAIVGGHSLGAPLPGSLNFQCHPPFDGPLLFECDGSVGPSQGPGGFSFRNTEKFTRVLTEDEFNSHPDVLAFMLLMNSFFPCGPPESCVLDAGPYGKMLAFEAGVIFDPITSTRVPTPGPLSLFVAGVVGLALSRRRKHLDSSPSPAL